MKESVDVTIIGAGVVGLALAEAMAAKNLQVVVLEKNDSLAKRRVPGTVRLLSITRKNS